MGMAGGEIVSIEVVTSILPDCVVCHTDLDEIEGRLKPAKLPTVLGHQIVGVVTEKGINVTKFKTE